MMKGAAPRRLPVVLPPHLDELLSSWIGRHASFYAVPPLIMLRHCLPDVTSLRAADLHLSSDQEIRLASMFSTEPTVIRRMTFGNVMRSSHRLLAARSVQYCTNCSPGDAEPAPVLRSQLLGWRITCPLCGSQLRDAGRRELPSPFRQYHRAALRGEKLLGDETEHGLDLDIGNRNLRTSPDATDDLASAT
jgi:TniQ